MSERRTTGWAWPSNAAKAHYFKAGRSLCGKWALFGAEVFSTLVGSPSPDDCRACWKKLG